MGFSISMLLHVSLNIPHKTYNKAAATKKSIHSSLRVLPKIYRIFRRVSYLLIVLSPRTFKSYFTPLRFFSTKFKTPMDNVLTATSNI